MEGILVSFGKSYIQEAQWTLVAQDTACLMAQKKGCCAGARYWQRYLYHRNNPRSKGLADTKQPVAAYTLVTEEATRNLISEHFDFDATGYEVSIPLPWLRAEQILWGISKADNALPV